MAKGFDCVMQRVSGVPGTGPITLGPALPYQRTFAQKGAANGDLVSYRLEQAQSWEIGIGTYGIVGSVHTLTRTTVLDSTNGGAGAPINADATCIVISTFLAADINPTDLTASVAWDPPSLAAGASATQLVTVAGAASADTALASFSAIVALTGWLLSAQPATGGVRVTLLNATGATADLASGTLRVRVFKA